MAWTLTTSAAAKVLAGANYNTALNSSLIDGLSDVAEGYICGVVNYDVITNWGSLSSNFKKMITGLTNNLIAQDMINYDLEAFGTSTATQMLNVLENKIRKTETLLKDVDVKASIGVS